MPIVTFVVPCLTAAKLGGRAVVLNTLSEDSLASKLCKPPAYGLRRGTTDYFARTQRMLGLEHLQRIRLKCRREILQFGERHC